MTVTTEFLGFSITALVYRSHTGRWEIEDLTITNDGHDLYHALNKSSLLEIEERVIIEAQKQDYKWL